ncbi:hypothetical protein P879_09240 [Paragonimus westermani]|uniref:Uncharacterized protein n=1 Tax=Paragonimus westermani TaxID=34504 RepID=A0A8T0D2E5_9TREM|nr:hypothetical protein P879_09240 [Paragonimus westermani]
MSGSIDRKKNQKGFLKEKVLQIYDKLFQGQDITQGRAGFWDDFFLLKVNVKWLNTHFEKAVSDDLIILKPQLNRLLLQCLHTAEHDKHRIRVANAIQTMDALVSGVYRCKTPADSTMDASEFLINPEQVTDFMQHYTTLCSDMFRENRPERLRSLMLNSMHTFVTASSDFRSSPFAIGLLNVQIFDLLRLTLVNAQLRYLHGLAACKLLGLLTQFGKSQTGHVFTQQLGLSDDDLLLNGVSSTISLALSEYNVRFRRQHDPSVGFFSSMSSFFGNLFVGDIASNVSLRPCDSLLMCMYAITKNGAHFSTILSYSNAHHYDTTNGFDSLSASGSLGEDKLRVFGSDLTFTALPNNGHTTVDRNGGAVEKCERDSTITKTLTINDNPTDPVDRSPPTGEQYPIGDDVNSLTDTGPEPFDEKAFSNTLEPRNLLADLLEYCSIVMQDVKSEKMHLFDFFTSYVSDNF